MSRAVGELEGSDTKIIGKLLGVEIVLRIDSVLDDIIGNWHQWVDLGQPNHILVFGIITRPTSGQLLQLSLLHSLST